MLINIACSNRKQPQKPISLEPVKRMLEPNDSTFMGDIGGIKYANNRLYLADNSPQVLQLGPDLDLLGRIKENGKGPGEFTTVMDMSIVNDSLYLYDRQQAKILVYNHNNNFIWEVRLPEASGYDMVVGNCSQIFLSTPNREYPITKFNSHGQKISAFGHKTVSNESNQYRRNWRFLFIHNDKLIAIAKSEPLLEVYSLEGQFIRKADIAPPEIHDLIERVKRENESYGKKQPINSLNLIFIAAAVYKDSIYLLEAKRPKENTNIYDTKFTYLFKYKLEADGNITLDQTFKLFRSDRDKLLYGFRLEVVEDHTLIVYDLMGKNLLVYKDKHL